MMHSNTFLSNLPVTNIVFLLSPKGDFSHSHCIPSVVLKSLDVVTKRDISVFPDFIMT